ncbi:MAG: TRAP transporter small permease subunit [Synergistaceae bacterium]|jgi:TRAP-type C4-dicarboxylate transport system permease small subunit|nr:TRAP transporter small permease subunit [Synergistaceae bacterium]
MKRALLLLWNLLDIAQQAVMVATSVAIVILILAQVSLRYVFMMPLMGVEELACLFGFWLYFTGAANGARERNHIKADLLNVFIKSERVLHYAKATASFFLIVLSAIFAQWTVSYFIWSMGSWERSPALSIPMVFAQASLMVNSILMFVYFFIEFVDYARQAIGYPPLRLAGHVTLEKEGE